MIAALSVMQRRFPVYASFARNSFLNMLAYRLRYYTGILTYLLMTAVNYYIWQAVYANRQQGVEIHGFTLADMVTYVSVGWIARTFYFSNIDYEIDDLVHNGQISTYLIRPANFQLSKIAEAVGEALFRICLFSVPVGLTIVFFFPVKPPASVHDAGLFILSTVLGFFVLAEFNFLVGLLAFWFQSIQGVIRAKYYVVQLCSGLILPMAFFPGVMRNVLECLPFQAVAYVPLKFYLGQLNGEKLWWALGNQLCWIVVLSALGRVFWMKAVAKIAVQGG